MAATYTLIESYTVGSGGASSVTLGSGGTIPNTYTDLLVKVCARSTSSNAQSNYKLAFNSGGTYSRLEVDGYGSTAASYSATGASAFEYLYLTGTGGTSSTFCNAEIYIPNYTSSNAKSFSIDSVQENNSSTTNYLSLMAGLWSGTATITSIVLTEQNSNNFAQYSTFYLYGIKNT